MKTSRCILIFLSLFALVLAFVQISEGVAIQREKQNVQSELVENESSTDKLQQLQKKQGIAKKSKYPKPIVIEKTKKYSPKPKYKMTELKPCISKAFCEVNAITEEPTYETNKEFYLILSRLKKFTANVNERDLNGSGSFEEDDDDSGSSEEPSSYERVPLHHDHQSQQQQQSQDQPLITNPLSWFSGLRRGKSLNETDDKALLAKKHKKINKLKKFLKKSNVANSNGTKTEKILTPAQLEKRELVARKTKELNVVDDLAALIKISAEIGQALRSPRRCRNLFKKCQMSYDQIIGIFNQSQSVETSEPELFPTSPTPTFPSRRATKLTTPYSTTSATSTTTEETTIKPTHFQPTEVVNNDEENISIEDGNRDKKSRTDFSDEDYIEADGESQPVKTYSLLDQVIDRQQQPQQYSKYEDDDTIDEGFQMFDKAFPSTAPKTTGSKSKKYQPKQQQVQPSESSEEDESSSVSAERLLQNDERYSHRASGEAKDFNDVPLKKHSKHPQAEADEIENDSDQEIPSSEIDKRPIASNPQPIPGTISGEQSSEEQSDEENGGQQELYTRDEQEYTYPHYPNVRPSYDRPLQNAQRPSHKTKNHKKQKKTGDDSSEEKPDAEEFMPPSNSKFYQVLKTVDNGKGASVIPPGTNPYEKKQSGHHKKGKRKNKKRNKHEAEDVEDEVIYSGQNGPYGQLQASPSESNYYGYNSQQSADQSSKPSIFQSIMGWFRGNPGSDEQQYGSNVQQHGYGTENEQQQFNPYGSPYPQQNGYNTRPSSQQQPYTGVDSWKNKRHPSSSQGRREGDSSEEEEEEEDDQDDESAQQQPNKRETHRGPPQKRRPSPNLGANNGILVNHQGPPPPLVIDPGYPQQVPNNLNNRKKNNNKNNNNAPQVENEESRELTSSEEILDKQEQKAVNNKPQKTKSKKPLNEKVFDDLYLSAVDMDKHAQRQKEAEDRENTSLLLSTFDSIANKFSTSANKVPNWDEEDNPKKKINVASLHTNGHLPQRKYTVQKNKHKSQASYEANEEIKNSSEEEEEDKK